MGGLLTLPAFLKIFPQIDTVHPPAGWTPSHASNVQGITVGGYTLGCFFGAVATIWLGNLLGRKRTIFTGSSIMIVGALLQCTSFSLAQLIAARLITGFGNGEPLSPIPTYSDGC
jgi:MFS family permease